MSEPARVFPKAVKSVRGEEPLLIGCIGPPGGGKTVSSLRLAAGMKTVRSGPVVLIDTEGGRSKKYSADFDFLRVDFPPPFRSNDFLAVIKQQLPLNPSAIIVDSLSDEHEGEGGYLEWHDEIASLGPKEPGNVGGNEWAAWAKPKAARKRLISGLLQIKVPLLFTFRAREKTAQQKDGGKTKVVNIGWMPVAPLEIVHALDLTCILPPRANGVPVWRSEKIGEDFIVKLPSFLASCIREGALSEETGAALARWAAGTVAPDAEVLEAIKAALAAEYPGSSAEVKQARLALVLRVFGVGTWKEVCALPADKLRAGLPGIRGASAATATDGEDLFGEAAAEAELDPGAIMEAADIADLYREGAKLSVSQDDIQAELINRYGEELEVPMRDRAAILSWIQSAARKRKP